MKKKLLIGFILCVSLTFSAYGQFVGINSQVFFNRVNDRTVNLDFQVSDPSAIAMGNAFVAIANNPSAMYWNPAGLTQMHQVSASFVTQFNFNARTYTEPEFSGRKILSDITPHFSFPSFTAVIPIKIGSRHLNFGLGYHKLINPVSDMDDTEFSYGGGRIDELKKYTGGTHTIAAAVAVDLIPQISVGLTYHYLFGVNNYEVRIKSPYIDNRTYFLFNDEEEASGGFLNLGILLKPVKWVALGATVTPGWTYIITENNEKFELADFNLDEGWSNSVFETPPDSLNKINTKIPMNYSLGIALHPLSNLTLAFSYENCRWTKAEITSDGEAVSNTMEDVAAFHYGFEYRAGRSDLQVPLRLGYYTGHEPQKDQFFEGAYYGGQIKCTYWALGIGVHRSHLLMDFSYQQGTREIGWWMRSADYYNERMFFTNDTINQVMLTFTYRL